MFANPGFLSDRRLFEGEIFWTANQLLDIIKTVDGAGSGLDADLLDGNHASAFSLAGHTHVIANITDLGLFSTVGVTPGLTVGSNGVGNSYFLRADGSWAIPSGGSSLILEELADGDSFTVTDGYQYLVGEGFTVSGTLTVDGTLHVV